MMYSHYLKGKTVCLILLTLKGSANLQMVVFLLKEIEVFFNDIR